MTNREPHTSNSGEIGPPDRYDEMIEAAREDLPSTEELEQLEQSLHTALSGASVANAASTSTATVLKFAIPGILLAGFLAAALSVHRGREAEVVAHEIAPVRRAPVVKNPSSQRTISDATTASTEPSTPLPMRRSKVRRPPGGERLGAKSQPTSRAPVELPSEPVKVLPEDPGRSIEAESAIVARAQDALASDAERALELADEHHRLFPTGVLAEEREVIAIDALARLRRVDAAAARARELEIHFPKSPHRHRVRALVDSMNDDQRGPL
jgi:hypothetical protein